jgi:hypothetical protein
VPASCMRMEIRNRNLPCKCDLVLASHRATPALRAVGRPHEAVVRAFLPVTYRSDGHVAGRGLASCCGPRLTDHAEIRQVPACGVDPVACDGVGICSCGRRPDHSRLLGYPIVGRVPLSRTAGQCRGSGHRGPAPGALPRQGLTSPIRQPSSWLHPARLTSGPQVEGWQQCAGR